jgi:hypothetical protein
MESQRKRPAAAESLHEEKEEFLRSQEMAFKM